MLIEEPKPEHVGDPRYDWRERIRRDLEIQRRETGLYGNDAFGNACRFHPDGRVEILRSAAEVAAADRAIFGGPVDEER